MIDQNIYQDRNFHGVKGIVFIGDKMLVYRRDTNTSSFPLHIDLPGGGKEGNESPFETFKREVKEEFGIDISMEDVVYGRRYVSAMDPTKESYFIVTKPLPLQEDDIVFGDEGLEFSLLTLDEYLRLDDAIGRQQEKVKEYIDQL